MESLSHLVAGRLSPSSQSGGNTVSDDPKLSGTAPGSSGVNDFSQIAKDHLPEPDLGAVHDYARTIGADGSKSARPSQSDADLVTGREWPR